MRLKAGKTAAIVCEPQHQPVFTTVSLKSNHPCLTVSSEAVAHRILCEGLQQHAGHQSVKNRVVRFQREAELFLKADTLNFQVALEEIDFLTQRHFMRPDIL